MDYIHIVYLLTMCGGLVGGREELENCRSTYYIHEYHVHTPDGQGGVNASEAVGNQNDVMARDASGKALITRDELVTEKSRWERQMKDLQARLLEEQTLRLQQMSHFVDWTRRLSRWSDHQNKTSVDGDIRLLQDVAKNLTGMMEKEQQELKRSPIVVKEPPVFVPLPTPNPTQAESKRKTRVKPERAENFVFKDSSDAVDTTDADDNSTRNGVVAEFVEDLKKEMADMKKTVDEVARKYLHLFKTNKRLTMKQKRIERECRKSEGRSERLQMYHRTEIQKLRWKLGNESDLWNAGLKNVHSNLICLDNTGKLCAGGKETRPVSGRNKPVSLVMGSLPTSESQNDKPIIAPLRVDPKEATRPVQQQKPNDNETQVMASQPSVTSQMMIEAGVKVSQWYLDQVVDQRPKDCSDIDFWVQRQEPVQTIYLLNKTRPVKVMCEEGWTIIQKNIHTGSQIQDAPNSWDDYKLGFGELTPDADFFWIGNQYLHWLTQMNKQDYQLRIDMRRQSDYYALYSEYAFFQVSPEKLWYRLAVGDCSGTAGDIMGLFSTTNLNDQPFSTQDRSLEDVYGISARNYHVGWWYSSTPSQMGDYDLPNPCFTNLNHPSPWYCSDEDTHVPVASVVMKIKPS